MQSNGISLSFFNNLHFFKSECSLFVRSRPLITGFILLCFKWVDICNEEKGGLVCLSFFGRVILSLAQKTGLFALTCGLEETGLFDIAIFIKDGALSLYSYVTGRCL